MNLVVNICNAQNTVFHKLYDKENVWEAMGGCIPSGGGYLGVVKSIGYTLEQNNIHFLSITEEGEMIWQKTYYDDYTVCTPGQNALIQASDETILFAGAFRENEANLEKGLLIKLNEEGDTLWTRLFPGNYHQGFKTLKELPNGNIVLIGSSQTLEYGTEFYLVKTTSDGELIWESRLGGEGYQGAYSVDLTHDSGYIMSGKGGTIGAAKIVVIKADSLGQEVWKKTLGGNTNNDGWHYVKTLQDGNYLVAASKGHNSLIRQSYMVKLDLEGEIIWEKKFPSGYKTRFGTNIIELGDGNIVVGGSIYIHDDSVGDYVNYSKISKFTSEGDPIWERIYTGGGHEDSYFYGILESEDGGFLAYGSTIGEEYPIYKVDAWLIKMDSEGNSCPEPGCSVTSIDLPVGIERENIQLKVGPNPAGDWAKVYYFLPPGIQINNLTIEMHDESGKSVFKRQLQHPEEEGIMSLDVNNLPSGIYYVCLKNQTNILKTISLIKQ